MADEILQWNFPDSKRIRHIDFKNKEEVTELLVKFMLQRTNSMFEWKGFNNKSGYYTFVSGSNFKRICKNIV